MNPENEEPENETTPGENLSPEIADAELIAEAELVEVPYGAQTGSPQEVVYSPSLPPRPTKASSNATLDTPLELKNIKAKGGAVGAVVLGLLAIFGSFLTAWSAVNAVIGFLMGMWGLSSPKRKLAMIGVALCTLGAIFSLVDVSQIWAWADSSGESEF